MVIIIYATYYTSSYVWVGLKVVAFTCVCLLKCVSKCLGVGVSVLLDLKSRTLNYVCVWGGLLVCRAAFLLTLNEN